MVIANLIQVFAGLALLLLGIDMLSLGMEKLAGKQIQAWLDRMTDRPLKGAIFGFAATTVLQSSSLLMVTMIGLINANLFTLQQAVSVMMGQEIGTTLTGQLIAFDISKYILVVIIIGYGLQEFAREKRRRALGQALLGIGIVFLSLETMKSGIRPLIQQPWVQSWLATMGQVPLLGVAAGAFLTALIHSSSGMTGLTIALGVAGAITLPGAISLILGANIGTCFTGWIAALRSCRSARRASLAQIMINIFGVALFFPFIAPFSALLARTSTQLGRQIANAHTVFNIAVSLILFPLVPVIVRTCKVLIPGDDVRPAVNAQFLDENLMQVPSIALGQAAKRIVGIGNRVGEMLAWSREALLRTDPAAIRQILTCEAEEIDPLCRTAEAFLDRLLRAELSEEEQERCFQLNHLLTDIERVGDITENLAQAGQERATKGISFSSEATAELERFLDLVTAVWARAVQAMESGSTAIAQLVREGEEEIDLMEKQLRDAHEQRLDQGTCAPKADILFIETLRNLERIGDHADNLAVSVLRS